MLKGHDLEDGGDRFGHDSKSGGDHSGKISTPEGRGRPVRSRPEMSCALFSPCSLSLQYSPLRNFVDEQGCKKSCRSLEYLVAFPDTIQVIGFASVKCAGSRLGLARGGDQARRSSMRWLVMTRAPKRGGPSRTLQLQ